MLLAKRLSTIRTGADRYRPQLHGEGVAPVEFGAIGAASVCDFFDHQKISGMPDAPTR